MKNNLKLGVILFIITTFSGLLLGGVHELTKEAIAAQSRMSIEMVKEIMDEAEEVKASDIVIEAESNIVEVNEVFGKKDLIGYVVKVLTKGYGGQIELVVGIKTTDEISGIKIVKHSETPGVGARAEEEPFRSQYSGKKTSEFLEVTKSDSPKDNQISAVSGATITSNGVTDGVNAVMKFYREKIKGETGIKDVPQHKEEEEEPAEVDLKLLGFEEGTLEKLQVKISDTDIVKEVNRITMDDKEIGHVIKVAPTGMEGEILIAVGIDANNKVSGIQVLHENETEGLGTLILEESFTSQFKGQSADGKVEVDSISGATVSSDATIFGVNKAIEFYGENVKGKDLKLAGDSPEIDLKEIGLEGEDTKKIAIDDKNSSVKSAFNVIKGDSVTGSMVVVAAKGMGDMEIAVGINTDGEVTGYTMIKFNETEGIGDAVLQKDFVEKFLDKDAGQIDEIDTISGATISSEAVKKGVKAALEFYNSIK